MTIEDTLWYDDLHSDGHDPLYRALRYVQICGGPDVREPVDEVATLRQQRGAALDWMRAQDDWALLTAEYDDYRGQWSPIFIDES